LSTFPFAVSKADLESGKPEYIEPFLNALADDLNTANALFEVFNIVKLINQETRQRECDLNKLNNLFKTLTDMLFVLGLDIEYTKLSEDDINLYNEYLASKANKDFARSDEIRNELIKRKIM